MRNSFTEILLFLFGIFGVFFVFLLFCLFGALIGGTIFYFLWNWCAPLFWAGAPVLSWLQAFGVWFLITMVGKALFGRRE